MHLLNVLLFPYPGDGQDTRQRRTSVVQDPSSLVCLPQWVPCHDNIVFSVIVVVIKRVVFFGSFVIHGSKSAASRQHGVFPIVVFDWNHFSCSAVNNHNNQLLLNYSNKTSFKWHQEDKTRGRSSEPLSSASPVGRPSVVAVLSQSTGSQFYTDCDECWRSCQEIVIPVESQGSSGCNWVQFHPAKRCHSIESSCWSDGWKLRVVECRRISGRGSRAGRFDVGRDRAAVAEVCFVISLLRSILIHLVREFRRQFREEPLCDGRRLHRHRRRRQRQEQVQGMGGKVQVHQSEDCQETIHRLEICLWRSPMPFLLPYRKYLNANENHFVWKHFIFLQINLKWQIKDKYRLI